MINIGKIYAEQKDEKTRLIAEVSLPEEALDAWERDNPDPSLNSRYHKDFVDGKGKIDLWYEVENCYADILCTERSDAFVVATLYYAMITGEDVLCEVPITDKLFYQLNEYIIPALCQPETKYRRIYVKAKIAPQITSLRRAVGTGVSCGVDSFSAIVVNMKESVPQDYHLTHLALFNTGALNFSGYSTSKTLSEWNKETTAEFKEKAELGRKVATELGLGFIAINTNIPDLYQGCFLFSHTFRNCSAVLATQKMWKAYYYASAGENIQVNAKLTECAANYDLLTLMGISLDGLTFYSGCLPYQRMEKTALIADNAVVQKYLNVCSYGTKNCGRCEKCLRTITSLDLLGKLSKFTSSFEDLSYYRTNKWKLMACIMEAKQESPFRFEQRQFMKRNHINLSWKSLIYHYALPARKVWIWLHKLGRG